MLNLHCEAGAAAAEAQVLEMAEGLHVLDEAVATEMEDKLQHMTEYVQSQNAHKQCVFTSPPPIACPPLKEPDKSFVTHSLTCERQHATITR